ncbi:unannotated protein [freshwater metagenome]|uniref:signal peptidase I n=1 Tax=freshwater metagenome TaxID=449393 RepID=A0A6J6DTX4_9ZZZZ|nr:signal peptidase I [Actinomycetota bacterium]
MSDKQAKYFGKKTESAMMPKGKKRPVKESVENILSFKDMIKLVQESGGQQQIDAVDQELFSWAQRVAKQKIGEGGDNVTCCDSSGKVQVNGVSITEPYIYPGDKPSEMKFNVDIPKGFIWVMGDHRGASADSRFHPESANNGMIPLSKVVGRATFIVWPFTNAAFIPKGEDLKKVPVQEKP